MSRFLKVLFLCAIFVPGFTLPTLANKGKAIEYGQNGDIFEGYWVQSACDNPQSNPLILVVHQWKGVTDHEKNVAEKLSGQCYNAFVIDMYGKGIRPDATEEAAAQSSKYKDNPELARARLKNAMAFALQQSGAQEVAIIGYCFGGTMALEMARSGENIAGAVSFHGGLSSKAPATGDKVINASVLVHHGDADPLVKPEEVDAFLGEMRTANADWGFVRYADAVHAFTQKEAGNDPGNGVAYNEKADKRSWDFTLEFF